MRRSRQCTRQAGRRVAYRENPCDGDRPRCTAGGLHDRRHGTTSLRLASGTRSRNPRFKGRPANVCVPALRTPGRDTGQPSECPVIGCWWTLKCRGGCRRSTRSAPARRWPSEVSCSGIDRNDRERCAGMAGASRCGPVTDLCGHRPRLRRLRPCPKQRMGCCESATTRAFPNARATRATGRRGSAEGSTRPGRHGSAAARLNHNAALDSQLLVDPHRSGVRRGRLSVNVDTAGAPAAAYAFHRLDFSEPAVQDSESVDAE